MGKFIRRRLLLLIPILLGLSILVFVWIRALPGGPAQALLGERADPEAIEQIERQYGLDEPIHVQYWKYVQTVAEGDFGDSIATRQPVVEELKQKFPATIVYAALSGEEQGLWGGKLLANTAKTRGWKVAAVLNNDIVGNTHGIGGEHVTDRVRVFSEGIRAAAGEGLDVASLPLEH